jgi:hypothetical protein
LLPKLKYLNFDKHEKLNIGKATVHHYIISNRFIDFLNEGKKIPLSLVKKGA